MAEAMTKLLLEPHQDDSVLFATWTLLREKPHVITVLRSQIQEDRGTGITNEQRMAENACALGILGVTHEQWQYPDTNPNWEAIYDDLDAYRPAPEVVWVPAYERGGHNDHNTLSNIAAGVFPGRVRYYLTYVRGQMRTRGVEVPYEPEWPLLKLQALACFRSQILEPSTREWFLDEQREYAPS